MKKQAEKNSLFYFISPIGQNAVHNFYSIHRLLSHLSDKIKNRVRFLSVFFSSVHQCLSYLSDIPLSLRLNQSVDARFALCTDYFKPSCVYHLTENTSLVSSKKLFEFYGVKIFFDFLNRKLFVLVPDFRKA